MVIKSKTRSSSHSNRAFFLGFTTATVILIAGLFGYTIWRSNSRNYILAPDYQKSELVKSPQIIELEKRIRASETAARRRIKLKIPIIMYHYVEYVKDPGDTIRKSLDINPYTFEQQLNTLSQNGYKTYFASEISSILDGKIAYSTKSAILTFDDGYEDFFTDAFPLLEKYKIKGTVYIITNFLGRRGFLTEDQVRILSQSKYVEIGAHTLDHAYLKIARHDYARQQIFVSKAYLEELIGQPIKTFAYPFGAFDEDSAALVKEAGYTAAVSVIYGSEQSYSNLFFLNRIRAGYLGMGGEYMLKQLASFVK